MRPRAPDPDAVPSSNPAAIAYDARAMALGAGVRDPDRVLRYGPDRAQDIDLWLPGGPGPHPLLVFWHGGAWVSGHPGWVRFMAPAVLARGVALAAPGYRLAPRCHWPAQFEDALAAIEALAAEPGIDPGRITIGGHSAGGHLAAHVALRGHRLVRACLPVSAPLDLRYGDVPLTSDAGRVYRYLLARREDDMDASPIAFAAHALAPFHLVWGERDFDRVRDSGQRFIRALCEVPVHASHGVVLAASHFDTHLALADPAHPWYARLSGKS